MIAIILNMIQISTELLIDMNFMHADIGLLDVISKYMILIKMGFWMSMKQRNATNIFKPIDLFDIAKIYILI